MLEIRSEWGSKRRSRPKSSRELWLPTGRPSRESGKLTFENSINCANKWHSSPPHITPLVLTLVL
eukprot:11158484-Lingulodinium_polyedra.AAC.1